MTLTETLDELLADGRITQRDRVAALRVWAEARKAVSPLVLMRSHECRTPPTGLELCWYADGVGVEISINRRLDAYDARRLKMFTRARKAKR